MAVLSTRNHVHTHTEVTHRVADLPLVSAETVYVKLHSNIPEELWSAITHHRGNLDYHSLYIAVLRLYVWCDVTKCYSPPLDVTAGSYQNVNHDDDSVSDTSATNSDDVSADTRV